MLAGRIGGLRCGGPLFDLAVAESGDVGHLILCPFPWKGMPEGQGVGRRAGGWPKAKRAKPTSGATRHLLPEEGGRSGENYLLPSRGRGMPEGQGVGRRQRERSQPPALRATSFQRKEGKAVKTISPLPKEGGCPKGRGLGEGERAQTQPPALRATSFQRKEGEW